MSDEPAIALSAEDRRRIAALEEQARAGAAGIDALVDALADRNWVVRRAVTGLLARDGDAAAVALERALVERRSDEAQVAATVDALAASTGSQVTERMLALTEHPSSAIVCDALQILGRRRAGESVDRLGVLSASDDDNVAVAAIEALGRVGGADTVPPLLQALASRVFFRTFSAIDALGRSGDERVVAPLTALLGDSFYGLEAVRALGHTAQVSAVAPLAALLRKPADALVRTVAGALVDLRDRYQSRVGEADAVVEALQQAVEAPLASHRLSACIPGAGPAELVAIARLLAWLGDDQSISALIDLTDREAPVGEAALQSLRHAGPNVSPRAIALLPGAGSRRRARLFPLVTSAGGNLEPIVVCLDDDEATVRVLACEALSRLGDTKVVSSLFRLIGDADTRVAQASAAAIQSLGSRETRSLALQQARSSEPGVRRAALRILSYFGYPEALDILPRGGRGRGREDPRASGAGARAPRRSARQRGPDAHRGASAGEHARRGHARTRADGGWRQGERDALPRSRRRRRLGALLRHAGARAAEDRRRRAGAGGASGRRGPARYASRRSRRSPSWGPRWRRAPSSALPSRPTETWRARRWWAWVWASDRPRCRTSWRR